jgi:LysR family transcriptional regulator, transcriptional activator of nhaA
MKDSAELDYLNFHHLRYFWTVAREGTLRAAADKLSVSQPSICTQIKVLESALGEPLFRTSGRKLVMTEYGQLVYGYAEEIFTLGREIMRSPKQAPSSRFLRLNVGIVDSFPKLMSYEILRPVFDPKSRIQVTCHEGKLPDMVAQLTTHRSDIVLSDEPASPGVSGRVFNHHLGSSGVAFCAMPSLARGLKGKFPKCLHGATALLPTQNCNLRRDLEAWFSSNQLQPRIIGEFEDPALAKIVASDGLGFIVVSEAVLAEAVERYGFACIGRTREIQTQFYAITAERRITHPAVVAITNRKWSISGRRSK